MSALGMTAHANPISQPRGKSVQKVSSPKPSAAKPVAAKSNVSSSHLKSSANEDIADPQPKAINELITRIRARIQGKDWKWDLSLFPFTNWSEEGHSVNGMPLIYWTCGDPNSANSSLVLAAVHGDEITPVYFGFRLVEWLKARPEICKEKFIVVAPIVNPDGFLRYSTGTRTNFNKVDLNRNMDTPEWPTEAIIKWKSKAQGQRRYYPGDTAGSEPETKFQQWLINHFKPSKVLSIHSPLNMMDYDGPSDAEARDFTKKYVDSCEALRSMIKKATPALQFQVYGTFPGSLGNYAGVQRGIPTLTAELPTTRPDLAAPYFSALEEGTTIFFNYQLKGRDEIAHQE
jgi:protein MpaA